MKRYPVDSRLIKAIGWDEADGTVYVDVRGTAYAYGPTTEDVVKQFSEATSAGSFFGQVIKKLPYKGKLENHDPKVKELRGAGL